MAALNSARDRLAGLVAGKAPPEQLAAAATDMAKAQNGNIARTERRLWRDLGPAPDDATGGTDVIAKLRGAKTGLDAALAAPPSQDAGQIIDQTRLSLVNFAAFQDAYKTAMPVCVAAERKAFDALRTDTQSYLAQVAVLAKVEKPWFLASAAHKNAYKLRQDNAAQAKPLAQRLDDLAKSVASSSDLRDIAAAITQAADVKKSAGELYASSSAAAL